jgi:hypothetical protein
MYVIFVAWSVHENCEMCVETFPGNDKKQAESFAKRWLYITTRTFLKKDLTETDAEVSNFFSKNTLHDVIRFMHENSNVIIQYKVYHHE